MGQVLPPLHCPGGWRWWLEGDQVTSNVKKSWDRNASWSLK